MKRKVLDVSGEAPKLSKKKAPPEKVKKKPKKDEEIRKTKAEKAAEKEDKPKKKKVGKKKKRVGDLLAESDKESAIARLEQHAAIAGVYVPQEALQVDNPEAVFLQTYQRIFKRLRKFSRKMEKTMGAKDKDIQSRDVYALNVLYNQTREVMADMRSLIDMTALAETLCAEALDPLAKTSAQAVTTMLMTVQSVLRSTAPHLIEAVMDELKKSGAEIGTDLNNQLSNSRSRLTSILTQSR